MRVKALDTYKRLNVKDIELSRIPEAGEEFEVTEERFDILNGNNKYKEVFVEEVKEVIKKDNKSAKKISKKSVVGKK